MSYIRTNCPTCLQRIALSPESVQLRPGPSADVPPRYAFTCPGCSQSATKPADAQTYSLLLAAGVATTQPHPERPPAGPALTYDDVLDFHELLSRPDWFARLAATTA